MKNVIRDQDSFAKEVPSFTLDGQSKVNTTTGGLLSLAILILTLFYAIDTLIKMSEGSDPTVSQNVLQDYYTSSNELNLVSDTDFRLAFGWRPYLNVHDKALKFDPKLMRWIARITSISEEGAKTSKDLDTH